MLSREFGKNPKAAEKLMANVGKALKELSAAKEGEKKIRCWQCLRQEFPEILTILTGAPRRDSFLQTRSAVSWDENFRKISISGRKFCWKPALLRTLFPVWYISAESAWKQRLENIQRFARSGNGESPVLSRWKICGRLLGCMRLGKEFLSWKTRWSSVF